MTKPMEAHSGDEDEYVKEKIREAREMRKTWVESELIREGIGPRLAGAWAEYLDRFSEKPLEIENGIVLTKAGEKIYLNIEPQSFLIHCDSFYYLKFGNVDLLNVGPRFEYLIFSKSIECGPYVGIGIQEGRLRFVISPTLSLTRMELSSQR